MDKLNPNLGPLPKLRPAGRAEAGTPAEAAGQAAGEVARSVGDGVAASLKKLGGQLERLDASKTYMPKTDLNAIEAFLKKQLGGDGKTISPADIAPMYGMAWKDPAEVDPKPIDIAPMYGIAWKDPAEIDPRPIDIAPMYGIAWKDPEDVAPKPFPGPSPVDIAPMYGIAWREPEAGPTPAPAPVDIAPMYGMSFGAALPGND